MINQLKQINFKNEKFKLILASLSIVLICIYIYAFVSRGFKEFYDEKMDYVRAERILNKGLQGFYDNDTYISPYPPLALSLIALIKALSPSLEAFKTIFFLFLLLNILLFYNVLTIHNELLAPLILLCFLTFPTLRLGVITLHPTDLLFLFFLLLSFQFNRFNGKKKILSFIFLGLSIAIKWYSILTALLYPIHYCYKGDKKLMVVSALTLWLFIIFGLISPIFIFPNYLAIYSFHAEKSISLISWIQYSYGVKVPVLSLAYPLNLYIGLPLTIFCFLASILITLTRNLDEASLATLSLIPYVLFASTTIPYLRFSVYPFITFALTNKLNIKTLFFLAALFFFRYNFISVILISTVLYLSIYKEFRESA